MDCYGAGETDLFLFFYQYVWVDYRNSKSNLERRCSGFFRKEQRMKQKEVPHARYTIAFSNIDVNTIIVYNRKHYKEGDLK